MSSLSPGASIRVVANRTGIPADTLRMWERRYGFPKPSRREGGSRVYSEDDVSRLKLISRALAAGFRPSEAVPLAERDLARLVDAADQDTGSKAKGEGVRESPRAREHAATTVPDVAAVVDALLADDIVGVRTILRSAALALGPRAFVTALAHPLALRIGELWAEGRLEVRHEHLASACLRSQLAVLLAALDDGARAPAVLLAALPGEQHVLALEMIALYLATELAAPRILGADTPPDQIVAAAIALRADVVGITVSAASPGKAAARALAEVASALPRSTSLWVGGAGAPAVVAAAPRATLVATFADLDRALASVRAPR
ncbi:MAG: MerR family transcriptional regulator [Deltaproteobacteria bacterium]|nr:MerR family transcriptional regulator [Deltaproteobacteria bacterium]